MLYYAMLCDAILYNDICIYIYMLTFFIYWTSFDLFVPTKLAGHWSSWCSFREGLVCPRVLRAPWCHWISAKTGG